MPPEGVPKVDHAEILSFEEIVHFVRVIRSHYGLSKVRITGGEPLVRAGIVRLVEMLRRAGVRDLALTTNAQRLAVMAPALKRAGLSRVNVSLDSLDAETYAGLTGGGDPGFALAGIQAAVRCGLAPVKINTVLLRGRNSSEVTSLARWALDHGCAIRFLELMPLGWASEMHASLFVPSSEARAVLEESFDLVPTVRARNATSRDFIATDRLGRRGVVGFISSVTEPFCGGCRRLRLTSTGQLISCLARAEGPNVRDLLRSPSLANDEALRGVVAEALAEKVPRGSFTSGGSMAVIGG
jgi:cyclic pyranopterin phosphate synthase